MGNLYNIVSQKKAAFGINLERLVFTALIIALAGCATEKRITEPISKEIGQAVMVGNLANPQITEASGLASSRLYPTVLWVINDGGHEPMLFAVGIDGMDLGTFRVEDASNYDWEALASFELQDTAYLLIADVGDNWEQRNTCFLYVVEEPAITKIGLSNDTSVNVVWRIRFTYEDGPRDCEAVAVDAAGQRVILISKRGLVPVLYELPLQPTEDDAIAIAQRMTTVPYFTWPTDMDLAPDGRSAVVLTYDSAYLFFRRQNESWSNAFEKHPQRLQSPKLRQQEAACFGFYGKSVYVTSEKVPAPLVRIKLEESDQKP
ncbi:MAG: hypothetical protein PVI71_14295 [Desulfobacterales bacterium]|jgi:hypothetical protein